jgi:hypothetical protein
MSAGEWLQVDDTTVKEAVESSTSHGVGLASNTMAVVEDRKPPRPTSSIPELSTVSSSSPRQLQQPFGKSSNLEGDTLTFVRATAAIAGPAVAQGRSSISATGDNDCCVQQL